MKTTPDRLLTMASLVCFFSKGASDAIRKDIYTLLRIPEEWGNNKYFGLMFMIGRSKKDIFCLSPWPGMEEVE